MKNWTALGVILGITLLGACVPKRDVSHPKNVQKPSSTILKIEKHRNIAQKHYRLGMDQFKKGKHKEALRHFKRALPNGNNFALPHYGQGLVYLKVQNYDAASLAFAKAISIKPNFYQAYHGIARSQRMLGDFRGAERSYLAALKYAQKEQIEDSDLYFNLGILYEVYLGKKRSALKQYRQYVSLGGEHSQIVQTWIQSLER